MLVISFYYLTLLTMVLKFNGALTYEGTYLSVIDINCRPARLDAAQEQLLEESFIENYNFIEETARQFANPPFRRNLLQASIDNQSVAGLGYNSNTTQAISVLFRVRYVCDNCTSDLPMFSTFSGLYDFFSFDPWMGPTPDYFVYRYNRIIKRSTKLPAVDGTVGYPRELSRVECSEDIISNEANVVVDFAGYLNQASVQETELVAKTFMDTYNSLNSFASKNCDPYFREITAVVLDTDTSRSRRSLQRASGIFGGGAGFDISGLIAFFSFFFRVTFRCRGCPRDTMLLDDASRRLAEDRLTSFARFDQVGTDLECVCPVSPKEYRAPTRSEFISAFNTSIQVLTAQGEIDFIKYALEASEVEEVECSDMTNILSTDVEVEVTGNPAAITPKDTELLELAFPLTYNDLAESTCDSLFRTVINATITDVVIEGLQASRRELQRPRPNSTLPFKFKFRIIFKCRGCPSGTGIFSNDASRRLLGGSLRRIQLQSTCYCDSQVSSAGAPSRSNFAVAFDKTISDLNISSVQSVDAVNDDISSITGASAACNGDPHIITFDGLRFDCQGEGEFLMLKSTDSALQIQARFVGGETDLGSASVPNAMAISIDEMVPILQFGFPISNGDQSSLIGGCPAQLLVNGDPRALVNSVDESFVLNVGDERIKISYRSSGIEVSIRVWKSMIFGCEIGFYVFIPTQYSNSETLFGLLGSPNGDPRDDWVASNGTRIEVPVLGRDRRGEASYSYCTENWCIREPEKSLFSYESGTSFESFNKCDQPYEGYIDTSLASPELSELCGTDEACLIDGIVGGIEDAQFFLEEEALVLSQNFRGKGLLFQPNVATAGISTEVLVTAVLSASGEFDASGAPDRFNLYRIDAETGSAIGFVAALLDDGSTLSSDAVAGDFTYTNRLAFRSDTPGEVFAFQALPVFDGVEDALSTLVLTQLTGIRFFSSSSEVGGNSTNTGGGTLFLSSLEDLQLVIEYSWPATEEDLDTGTSFLGGNVGWACGPSNQFMSFSGDDTSLGGVERVTIDLNGAAMAALWNETVVVTLNAGWFAGARGSGPALVRIAFVNSNLAEISSSSLTLLIEPGRQGGCSNTRVGSITVSTIDNGFAITMSPV